MAIEKTERQRIDSDSYYDSNLFIQLFEPNQDYEIPFVGIHHSKQRPRQHTAYLNSKNFLGKGSFGGVYLICVKKSPNERGETKPNQEKVLKLFKLNDDSALAEMEFFKIVQEFKLARHTPLRMKRPVLLGNYAALIMNRAYGWDLCDLIEYFHNKTGDFISERIEITHKLLLALRSQVQVLINKDNKTEFGLIHADIKPENIRVYVPSITKESSDKKPKVLTVSFLDFGLASVINHISDKWRGTLIYHSPEIILEKKYSLASDIYALGKVILLLWIIFEEELLNKYFDTNKDYLAHMVARSEGLYSDFLSMKLVKEIPFIRNLIMDMINPDPEKRKNINELIKYFENEKNNYLSTSGSEASQAASSSIVTPSVKFSFFSHGLEYKTSTKKKNVIHSIRNGVVLNTLFVSDEVKKAANKIVKVIYLETDPELAKRQIARVVIQHAKGTADQPLMGPPKTSKNTLSNSSVS